MSTLSVSPDRLEMSTKDQRELAFDFSQLGTTVSSPGAQLTDDNGTTVALSDSPTTSGAQVLQWVRGSELTAGHSYTLLVWATVDSGNTESATLAIICDI